MHSPTESPVPRTAAGRSALFAALVAAGVAGNLLAYEIFFNIQFIFGSIFSMLALQFFRMQWGVLAAFLISLATYLLWNHPYAVIIMTAEALTVGLLTKRRHMGFVIADTLYWLFLGIPLVVLFYLGVMHLQTNTVVVTLMKQSLNGIANALLARLLYTLITIGRIENRYSFREIIFNLLALFVLLPSMLLVSVESRHDLDDMSQAVRSALRLAGQRVNANLEQWLNHNMEKVVTLAGMAEHASLSQMQKSIELTKLTEHDFLRMGLLDRNATIIAYSPLVDELGQKNIGKNFADRPFVPILKIKLRPMLSEVVMGRIGVPKPMVTMLAPVVVRGAYNGYITGILSLQRAKDIIAINARAQALEGLHYALLDRHDNVIVASREDLKPMTPLVRGAGEWKQLEAGISQWTPYSAKNVSFSDRWKNSFYVSEIPVGALSEWKLVLEQPIAPIQMALSLQYSEQFIRLFVLLLIALVIIDAVSRRIARSFGRLGESSTGLPARLAAGDDIAWPGSAILEAQQLTDNFRDMSSALAAQFREIRTINTELEARVQERTRELRESEGRLRTLIESTSDWIWEVDENARYTYSSPQVRDLLGYDPEEIIGKTPFDFMPPEEAERVSAEFGLLVRGRQQIRGLENVNIRKDGLQVVLETNAAPIVDSDGVFHGYRGIDRDITERKKTEAALRTSEERLTRAQRVAKIGNWDWEIATNRLAWSDEVFRIYGQDPLRDTPSYDTVINTLAPECRDQFTKTIENALQQGAHFEGEYRIIRSDGEVRYTHTVGEVVRDDAGRPMTMFGVVQDITERKLAEDRVRQLANEQQIILNTVAIGVAYAKERKLVWTNPAFQNMFGYGREETEAIEARRLYAEVRDYERVGAEGYARIATGTSYSTEVQAKRKDGTFFWLNLTGTAVKPGDPAQGSIWMFQDVTSRKDAAERLQESERLFREAIEFLPMPIGIAAEDGSIHRYNKSFVETYGFTVRDIPTIEAWLVKAYPDTAYRERCRQVWQSDVQKAVAMQGSTPTREYDVTCKDGRVKNVEITMRPIGSLFIAAFYDVTARKHVEKDLVEKTLQLEDLTRSLEQRVSEEIATRVKGEQLLIQQSKMAAMGEMLGAIAHQWRQPLNALGLIIQNLRDAHAYGELDKDYLERTVEKSMAQLRHMSKTIDDFRNFFQPDKERGVFDTMRAVGDVLSLFSAQMAASGIDFQLICRDHNKTFTRLDEIAPCPNKTMIGFRNEFEHVIMNLINNARDAIIDGRESGRLDRNARGSIVCEFRQAGGMVTITLSDNGGGMPDDILSRVFEPYFTTKGPGKGTGLGLYMSKVIIEDHMQGKLSARNGDEGAVFTIELPRA
ncbi:MAG: PAS domain S-box protein [Nitrospiraceae bacterium]|nr:PAS domain S-box protein [Nitrospiraceae bacterium]